MASSGDAQKTTDGDVDKGLTSEHRTEEEDSDLDDILDSRLGYVQGSHYGMGEIIQHEILYI